MTHQFNFFYSFYTSAKVHHFIPFLRLPFNLQDLIKTAKSETTASSTPCSLKFSSFFKVRLPSFHHTCGTRQHISIPVPDDPNLMNLLPISVSPPLLTFINLFLPLLCPTCSTSHIRPVTLSTTKSAYPFSFFQMTNQIPYSQRP